MMIIIQLWVPDRNKDANWSNYDYVPVIMRLSSSIKIMSIWPLQWCWLAKLWVPDRNNDANWSNYDYVPLIMRLSSSIMSIWPLKWCQFAKLWVLPGRNHFLGFLLMTACFSSSWSGVKWRWHTFFRRDWPVIDRRTANRFWFIIIIYYNSPLSLHCYVIWYYCNSVKQPRICHVSNYYIILDGGQYQC
jgi:hypothetical protein